LDSADTKSLYSDWYHETPTLSETLNCKINQVNEEAKLDNNIDSITVNFANNKPHSKSKPNNNNYEIV
jgi:hypothetical protein